MLELQGKEIGSGKLIDFQVQLVRTYKGEIYRTQTGEIASFPNSFVTVGLSIVLQGARADMLQIEQILLSADVLKLAVNWKEYDFSGKFSCTSNQMTELKDSKETISQLSVSLVSDGTPIYDHEGTAFTISVAGTTTPIVAGAAYGQVYQLDTPYEGYKFNGFAIPDRKILVLGNVSITE